MPMMSAIDRQPINLVEGCSVKLVWGNEFRHNLKCFVRRNLFGRRVELWTDGEFTWTASGRIKSPRCLRHDRAYDIAEVIDPDRRWWPTPADDRSAHYYDPTGMTEFRIQQLRKAARVAATTAFIVPPDTMVFTESPPCQAFATPVTRQRKWPHDQMRDLIHRITMKVEDTLSQQFGVDQPDQARAIGRAVAFMIMEDRERDEHNSEIGNTISKSEEAEPKAERSSQTGGPICAATGEAFAEIPQWRLINLMKTGRITRDEYIEENLRRSERFVASK